jgi:thioredoxin reductase/bacterioferritin-associated ferredoxin
MNASRYDLVVLGAGPAGAAAAIEARRHGLSVAVVDANARAGGQVYRAPSFSPRSGNADEDSDQALGAKLRSDLEASGADLLFRTTAWFVAPGMKIVTAGVGGSQTLEGNSLVIATGTSERIIPMQGVTLPGVIGLAAATILLKAHAVVPAGPTVVAGLGPLLYAVAAGLLKAGGRIAVVVDLARPTDWLAALPGLASRPDLLRRGIRWMLDLRRSGVPLRFGRTVTAIHGDDAVREVDIRMVGSSWSGRGDQPAETFAAGSVTIGHGLIPATEVARVLGVDHQYRAERGGWTPHVAADRSTNVPGVYIAGDCAGISGAAAASLTGALAGLTVARDIGAVSAARYEEVVWSIRSQLSRAERFGWTISQLMTPRVGLADAIARDTVVCRCEDVTRSTIDKAVEKGAQTLDQLKSTTRCGMGPCQGRICGEATADLMALARRRPRSEIGQWTARPPLRPVPLSQILGDYTYDDILKPPLPPG